MGGDSCCSSLLSSDEDYPDESISSSGDKEGLKLKLNLKNYPVIDGVIVSDSNKFHDVGLHMTSIDEAAEKQRLKVYTEVLRSYENLQPRIDRLEEAKCKILSYTPGSWADKAPYVDLSKYDIPNATCLLLIGPKGSGKSSLVNKISRLLEADNLLPARAQVSCSSSNEDGTFFLHKYTIPRGSASFCLYDTRCLSSDSYENLKMIRRWMRKGVRHGELITRKSDSMALKAQLKCKGWRSSFSSQAMPVGFVIFVVNGLTLFESMNSSDEEKKEYTQVIATNFNNPFLSFKDDKPAIVMTHGDLLQLSDRVRVRAYLGELLGVPPTGQIFDIPENNDPATTLAIFDMLIYCLDRADRNLPTKDLFQQKIYAIASSLIWLVAAAVVIFGIPRLLLRGQPRAPPTPPPFEVEWHKIRHLWL